jgi:hypothetical protein
VAAKCEPDTLLTELELGFREESIDFCTWFKGALEDAWSTTMAKVV